VDWLVEAKVSEKRNVSIFRAEVITSALKMETATSSHGALTQKIIINIQPASDNKTTCYFTHLSARSSIKY
jgi:hypothetical protein